MFLKWFTALEFYILIHILYTVFVNILYSVMPYEIIIIIKHSAVPLGRPSGRSHMVNSSLVKGQAWCTIAAVGGRRWSTEGIRDWQR